MKNILLTLSAAVVLLAACKSESEKKNALEIDKSIVFTDTSAMKQGNYSTDVATPGNNAPAFAPEEKQPQTKPQVRTITKVVKVIEKQQAPVAQAQTPPPPVVPPVVTPAEAPVAQAPAPAPSTGAGTGTTTAPSETATVPVPEAKKKEGWSGAAKGAAIGGIGGAVAGAVIGKGGKGAVIGGVVGAAGGYILGRKADKKSGRANLTTN